MANLLGQTICHDKRPVPLSLYPLRPSRPSVQIFRPRVSNRSTQRTRRGKEALSFATFATFCLNLSPQNFEQKHAKNAKGERSSVLCDLCDLLFKSSISEFRTEARKEREGGKEALSFCRDKRPVPLSFATFASFCLNLSPQNFQQKHAKHAKA